VCTVNASAKPDAATHFAGTDAMTYEPSLALTMLLGTRTLYTPSLEMSAFSASVSSDPNVARVARGELKRKFLASFLSTASFPVTTPAGANVDSSSECSKLNVISSPPRRAPSRAGVISSDAARAMGATMTPPPTHRRSVARRRAWERCEDNIARETIVVRIVERVERARV
jgi:hypothetical protein